MRKPSSLISCTHCGPEGGFSTGWETWGGTNWGRGTSPRDRPTLTGCEAERLTTRDMTGNPTRRNCHTLTLLSGERSRVGSPRETKLEAALIANARLREAERPIAASLIVIWA